MRFRRGEVGHVVVPCGSASERVRCSSEFALKREAVQSGDVLLQPHPTRAEPNAARRPGRSLIQVVWSLNHGLFDRLKKLSGLGREVLGLSEVVGCVCERVRTRGEGDDVVRAVGQREGDGSGTVPAYALRVQGKVEQSAREDGDEREAKRTATRRQP